MASKTPDRTKIETGDQQSERTGLTREPQISYDENGKRVRANEVPDRTDAEQTAFNNAQIKATGNRRDDVVQDSLPSDNSDFTADDLTATRH